jgi:hypothetical protein
VFISGFRVVFMDIFMLETGESLATLEASRELVVIATGCPLVSLKGFRELVAMVIEGPLVSLESSRELVAMVIEAPLVLLEGSRELVAMVTEGPLVSSEGFIELVAIATGGPLVSLMDSRKLVAAVTGGPLVPLEGFRELNVMIPPLTMESPTAESPVALEVSGSTDDFLVASSWEVVDSGSPVEVPKRGKSLIPKGVGEDGLEVRFEVLPVSLGSLAIGPMETAELSSTSVVKSFSEVGVSKVSGVSVVITGAQKPQKRIKSRAISIVTGTSRS